MNRESQVQGREDKQEAAAGGSGPDSYRGQRSPVLRLIRRSVLVLAGIFLLLVAASWVLAVVYEDEVKKLALEAINGRLRTEISVQEADLTLIRKFPYASLRLKDVLVRDAVGKEPKDTLLFASFVYLQFNLFDLLREDYRLRKVTVEDGVLKLRVYADGSDNYHIWKPDDTVSGAFRLDLAQVALSAVRILYDNRRSGLLLSGLGREAELSGRFSEKTYDAVFRAGLFVDTLRSDTMAYILSQPVVLSAGLLVDRERDSYSIRSGSVAVAGLELEQCSGTVRPREGHTELDLRIGGKNLELGVLQSLLPAHYRRATEAYSGSGRLDIEVTVKGKSGGRERPEIFAAFSVNGGTVIRRGTSITLEEVKLTGSFSNGSQRSALTSAITLSGFSCMLGGGAITGRCIIENLASPVIECSADAVIDLQKFTEFVPVDTLDHLAGEARLSLVYSGLMKSPFACTADELRTVKCSGKIMLSDVTAGLKGSPLHLSGLAGRLLVNDHDLVVDSLGGSISGSDFALSGMLRNLLLYALLPEEKLGIEGRLSAGTVNLNELLATDPSSRDTLYNVHISPYLEGRFDINISQLLFRRFEAAAITGSVRLHNRLLTASHLVFRTMDGSVSASGSMDNRDSSRLLIACEARLENLDIRKLFHQVEDFGQDLLQEEHLRGRVSAAAEFSGAWTPALEADLDKVQSKITLRIEDGELIGYRPLLALSSYIRVTELEHIRFSTLENQVEIRDRKVFIPLMEVHSSAIDVSGSGVHTFNNEIDYRFRVLLSDVLFRKAKKARRENEEFGVIEDDGLGKTSLYLSMTGTVDEPVIRYDQKSVRRKLKDDFAKEKQNLKGILRQEFGIFKGDTAAAPLQKPKKPAIVIEWDEGGQPY